VTARYVTRLATSSRVLRHPLFASSTTSVFPQPTLGLTVRPARVCAAETTLQSRHDSPRPVRTLPPELICTLVRACVESTSDFSPVYSYNDARGLPWARIEGANHNNQIYGSGHNLDGWLGRRSCVPGP
jgi:hypothetical protein